MYEMDLLLDVNSDLYPIDVSLGLGLLCAILLDQLSNTSVLATGAGQVHVSFEHDIKQGQSGLFRLL